MGHSLHIKGRAGGGLDSVTLSMIVQHSSRIPLVRLIKYLIVKFMVMVNESKLRG
jgi:hypothetical protein